ALVLSATVELSHSVPFPASDGPANAASVAALTFSALKSAGLSSALAGSNITLRVVGSAVVLSLLSHGTTNAPMFAGAAAGFAVVGKGCIFTMNHATLIIQHSQVESTSLNTPGSPASASAFAGVAAFEASTIVLQSRFTVHDSMVNTSVSGY